MEDFMSRTKVDRLFRETLYMLSMFVAIGDVESTKLTKLGNC